MTGQFRQRLYETLGVLTTLLLFLYLWISEMIPWARHFTKQNDAIQQELHSRITAETPISGFYGPGAWWAWLITTGMAHGHVAMALWKTRELPSGWNPDFIVASLCTVAAEIDLIAKSRAIARLGETASQTVLLPALVSAERAVVVGSGSALVSTVVGLFLVFFGHSKSLGIRTAGIALIPVLLGFVASAFTLSAHRTIAQTAPVFWCLNHSTELGSRGISWNLVHFPANILTYWCCDFPAPPFWLWMVPPVAMAALIFILDVTQNEYSWKSALWGSTKAAALSSVTISPFVCFPCLTITPLWAAFGLNLRLALWWPMYILAFFPQLPYFPITGISIREMDQITALLGVAVVAALRIVRHVIPSC